LKQLTTSLWEIGAGTPERDGLPIALMFPFAGGSAYSMAEWRAEFAPAWRTVVVQYPGTGRRYSAPPARSLRELGEAAADELLSLGTTPPLLIGHSMGALVAHCTAVELERRGTAPSLLLASAASAPHRGTPEHEPIPLYDLPDDEFVDALHARGGIPEEAVADRTLLELFLPGIRADLKLVREHLAHGFDTVVSCPVLALGGSGDDVVPTAELAHWSSLTTGRFARSVRAGDHFFFRGGLDGLAQEVGELIGAARTVARP
jgi:surfactin synthase thioesterase subunit